MQASFYGQLGHSKLLTIKWRFQDIIFSPSGFIVSEFQRYNIDDLYDSTHLHQLFSSRLGKNHSRGITAHTLWLWRFHGEHQVNMNSFWVNSFYLQSTLIVMYTCQIGVTVLGVWSILPLIIKRIFPCSFGNKRICLLTRVYCILFWPLLAIIQPSILYDGIIC